MDGKPIAPELQQTVNPVGVGVVPVCSAQPGVDADGADFFPHWSIKWSEWTRRSPIRRYERTKRLLDLIFLAAALPFLIPIFALISLSIKLDDGGRIFYLDKRYGKDGKPLTLYKFRTMCSNSDQMVEELMYLNEVEWPEFLISNDPRVTKIGRLLRRTSLDELPQLLNVAKGELSLIGPRASSVPPEAYDKAFLSRLDVIPGIAGPGHMWRRSEVFERKCELDVAYVRYRSTPLDLYLIVQAITVAAFMPKAGHPGKTIRSGPVR